LSVPQVDRVALSRLASETGGRVIDFSDASVQLPLLASAERIVPLVASRAVWDAPVALILFTLLLTAEWVGRKWFGMT